MSAALLAPASADAKTNCHLIVGNWVNAATKNCHEEIPGESYGGGSEVTAAPPKDDCQYEWTREG